MGYSSWDHKESDTTKQLTLPLSALLKIVQFPKDKALPTNSTALQSLWKAECLLFAKDLEVSAAAAAAKPLQSCPTLCDPIDGSPPGSPIPWILQARTLEWVAVSFSNA